MGDLPAEFIALAREAIGPLIGAAIAIFTMSWRHKERISARIIWDWQQPNQFRDTEEPRIHIHNRSEMPVMLASIELKRGLIFRRGAVYPLMFIDEPAFDFPYRIEQGDSWSYWLDKKMISREADKAGRLAKWLGHIRYPYVTIKVTTLAGTTLTIDAADGTPFQGRPRWLQR